MSMKLTPAAWTLTSACPGPGVGIGSDSSSIASGPPYWCTRIACIVAIVKTSASVSLSTREGWQIGHYRGAVSREGRPAAARLPCLTREIIGIRGNDMAHETEHYLERVRNPSRR